jgi:hypothetical protein
LNDFPVFHVRSRTFNAQRSRFNPHFAFRSYRSSHEAWSAFPNQKAESKAPEHPKRQPRIDLEVAVTFWSAALWRRFSHVR